MRNVLACHGQLIIFLLPTTKNDIHQHLMDQETHFGMWIKTYVFILV